MTLSLLLRVQDGEGDGREAEDEVEGVEEAREGRVARAEEDGDVVLIPRLLQQLQALERRPCRQPVL